VRVPVEEWWDIFTFTSGEPVIECPDCDELSPTLDSVWDAVQWVDRHVNIDCPASNSDIKAT